MYGSDQRRSLRVPFKVPARILGPLKPLEGHVDDLSRTGARLRAGLSTLNLAKGVSLADLGMRVQVAVRPAFEVELHYKVLGPLLTKAAKLVRLSLPEDDLDAFEIGCLFDLPLSNEETVMLGVPLPALKGGPEAWIPRADVAGPVAWQAPSRADGRPDRAPPVAKKPTPPAKERPVEATKPAEGALPTSRRSSDREVLRWRGFVLPSDAGRAPTLSCMMDDVSRLSVRLRIPRDSGVEGMTLESTDPAALGVEFGRRYGDHVGLKIMDGASHLWTGPTRVRAVEVPPSRPGEVLVTLAFDRSLTPPELSRLGLT